MSSGEGDFMESLLCIYSEPVSQDHHNEIANYLQIDP